MKKLRVLSLIATLALPIIANAEDESFTFNIPNTTLSSVLNDSFNLSAFDPSLGTLTGVALTLNLAATASPTVLNFSGGAASFTVSTVFPTTLTGPDGTSISATTASGSLSGAVNPVQFSLTTVSGLEVDQSVSASAPAPHFASYEGTTPLAFNLVAPSGAGFSTSGVETSGTATLDFGGNGSVGGSVSVDYTYTAAVPEPSSWALGLIAIGGLFYLRRRALRA